MLIDLHLHTSTAPKWTVSPPLRGFSRPFAFPIFIFRRLDIIKLAFTLLHSCYTMSPAADHFLR